MFYSGLDFLRMAVRALRARTRGPARAVVLPDRGTHGNHRHHPQLEQGLAVLVLALVDFQLAGELLDRDEMDKDQRA